MEKRFSFEVNRSRLKHFTKLLTTLSLISSASYAEIPLGLLGGTTTTLEGYSAFVSFDGTVTPLSGLSSTSHINAVSLNYLGTGLIGGRVGGTDGYAAFVSPDGTLSVLPLNLPGGITNGAISSTSINSHGNGIVGGNDGSNTMYGALVSKDGTITPIPLVLPGFIGSTALNDDGIALIGGEGNSIPYAAYVINGGVNPLDTSSLSGGHLVVGINAQGNGIIGEASIAQGTFAAFVSPHSPTLLALSPIPTGLGSAIYSVAINDSGIGLIGGNDSSNNIYAGLSDPTGVVTPLFTNPDPGQIVSVAINSSGIGLIGGTNNAHYYAALVQPNGSLTPLFTELVPGTINAVAINNTGAGLIGGTNTVEGYAALVAPNGTLTVLDMTDQATISSVALLNQTTPTSAGPYFSGFYTQLAASYALQPRFLRQTTSLGKEKTSTNALAQGEMPFDEDSLLVYNEKGIPWTKKRKASQKGKPSVPEKNNTVWIAPFYNYVRVQAQGLIPEYSNDIEGTLIGYDHHDSNYLVGTSAGYAFNYVDYSKGLGHSKFQEEMLSIYGAYYLEHFWFDLALWGGLYQLSTVRHTLSIITSNSSTHGWILSPHLEMASPWALDTKECYFIEPFFMLDWVNSWQAPYTEKGTAGFNVTMPSLYGSFLQSEAGLRFYERFHYQWGDFCLEEKLSYVNQTPFHFNTATTSFVGSTFTFPIAVGTTQSENLGSAQLISSFIPKNPSYPFGGVAFQVTTNGTYQSYFVSLFTGIDF